ncbi:MAG: radical SAM protein, partial [Firmicutes bacterium]|nr:radical SAM protein [Bacillota bacterium]
NDYVLKNLKLLQPLQDKVCIRIPFIPEFNTERDVENSIQKIKELGFKNIDVFTYNVNRSLSKQRR